jgi:hypothetical protein
MVGEFYIHGVKHERITIPEWRWVKGRWQTFSEKNTEQAHNLEEGHDIYRTQHNDKLWLWHTMPIHHTMALYYE